VIPSHNHNAGRRFLRKTLPHLQADVRNVRPRLCGADHDLPHPSRGLRKKYPLHQPAQLFPSETIRIPYPFPGPGLGSWLKRASPTRLRKAIPPRRLLRRFRRLQNFQAHSFTLSFISVSPFVILRVLRG
jgi:hypothetical protein